MDGTDQQHWQRVYGERAPTDVSWFQELPAASIALIEEAALPHTAALLDVGGGSARLARELLDRGYADITVADISPAALAVARAELGPRAAGVTFVVADVRSHRFARGCDLWHDRACLHFMVSDDDRDAYLATLRCTLVRGGHLVLATFGPDGPTRCSGLPVSRYNAEALSAQLGDEFKLISSRLQGHTTPSGAIQQFLYGHWCRRG